MSVERHASVTAAFYAAGRLAGRDPDTTRTPLHITSFSLAKTSTKGDTV
jgi:hypothetical protein